MGKISFGFLNENVNIIYIQIQESRWDGDPAAQIPVDYVHCYSAEQLLHVFLLIDFSALHYSVITRDFFCQHMSFSVCVSDEHVGHIYTAEEPHLSAQVRNRSIVMLLYCVAIHFMDLLMWYAY